MAIASEVIIGDEEPPVTLAVVFADRLFEVVRGAKSALATLDVDDRAERALVRAAAPEIQARQLAGNPTDVLARQDRRWFPFQWGEIAHVGIKRQKRAVPSVADDPIKAAMLGFAGKQRNAKGRRLAHLRRHFRQHRD